MSLITGKLYDQMFVLESADAHNLCLFSSSWAHYQATLPSSFAVRGLHSGQEDVLVRVLQRSRTTRICVCVWWVSVYVYAYKEIYYEDLAHVYGGC